MTYFAKLDATLTVIDVFTSNESDELNVSSRTNQTVRKTSKTGEFRKNFAGIGFTYDVSKDAFIPPPEEKVIKEKSSSKGNMTRNIRLFSKTKDNDRREHT